MPEAHPLNNIDAKINDRGYFERILVERDRTDEEREKRLDERFESLDKALQLQEKEYARRLHDLNGEYKRDQERQSDYVTISKYEDTLAAEKLAREAALLRVDEKFDDYVKRYEARQREVDQALTLQKGAAEAAQRIAEEQGRKSNRNLSIASLCLAALVFGSNFFFSDAGPASDPPPVTITTP